MKWLIDRWFKNKDIPVEAVETNDNSNHVDFNEPLKGKKWYRSKTIWVNLIAIGAMVIQMQTGYILDPEYYPYVLAGINMILRVITKQEILWER